MGLEARNAFLGFIGGTALMLGCSGEMTANNDVKINQSPTPIITPVSLPTEISVEVLAKEKRILEGVKFETSFNWPVLNQITQFPSKIHPALDIEAPYIPVNSAADGEVIFAGGDDCCSYGRYVVVMHAEGLESLYAHLSLATVKKGDILKKNQKLGTSGATGNANGAHLHFEIRYFPNESQDVGFGIKDLNSLYGTKDLFPTIEIYDPPYDQFYFLDPMKYLP